MISYWRTISSISVDWDPKAVLAYWMQKPEYAK